MRIFAGSWSEREITQAPLAQLTWYLHVALLEKLDDKRQRLWYAAKAVEHGWSRNILAFQIQSKLHARLGRPPNNFKRTLPPADVEHRVQRYGDFSKMNNRWYSSDSAKAHDRLAANSEDWAHYHALYRQLRQTWPVVAGPRTDVEPSPRGVLSWRQVASSSTAIPIAA